MCGIPQIVGGLKYVEFDFYLARAAAAEFLSHSFNCLVTLLAHQLMHDTVSLWE